jgi:hypothetical protein
MGEHAISNGFKSLLITLLAAHFLGDFLFQSETLSEAKCENKWYLLLHTSIVAGLSYVLCGIWDLWLIPVVIFVTHSLLDRLKGHSQQWQSFLLDQAGHIGIIVILSWFLVMYPLPASLMFLTTRPLPSPYWLNIFGPFYSKFLVVSSAFVVAVLGGAILVQLYVDPLLQQMSNRESQGLKGAGKKIGQLERSLILIFVLVGEITAVGFLVAAKSIFRFGELKNSQKRKEAEYIIIGTFISFLVALIIGYVACIVLKGLQ